MTNPTPPNFESEVDKILDLCVYYDDDNVLNIDTEELVESLIAAHQAAVERAVKEGEAKHIKTVEDTIKRLTPMLLHEDPQNHEKYAMYWDDKNQLWSRARYDDLIAEAKRQLQDGSGENG